MQCAGDSSKWGQSPVDIDDNHVLRVEYPPLTMSGHWNQEGYANIKNTGSTGKLCRNERRHYSFIYAHIYVSFSTVAITLEGNRNPASIRGGPLTDDVYEFSEVVFRWGSSNCKGAEHTLNGTWFTMEAQIIHFNLRYEEIEKCWDKRDGLAICSYFLQVYQLPAWDEHPLFSKITDNLYKITEPESTAKISPNCLSWMRQACQTPGYYSYSGSITTWPYYECATWIIFPEPVRISENQAQCFRMLRNKQGTFIKENYREVQKLNSRVIYYIC
uniref:carbonic anhydrase 7-like isoform X1 n=1 Tax=Vespula vulgaris TaxID=7454 RepID=UPI00223B62C4|nr:carbonic anhydrase 7-like isoform X1 [Vespula vulgaris]